jgi:hypothetical protein
VSSNINCEENFTDYSPKVKRGHSYKLCPFSTAYYIAWGLAGIPDPENPQPEDPRGNSRRFPWGSSYTGHLVGVDPITPGEHATTGGGMSMKSRGAAPGFLCKDPACPHFTTKGFQYFEI